MKNLWPLLLCLFTVTGCDGRIAGETIRQPLKPPVALSPPPADFSFEPVIEVAAQPPGPVLERITVDAAQSPIAAECLTDSASTLPIVDAALKAPIAAPVETHDLPGNHFIQQLDRILDSYRTEE